MALLQTSETVYANYEDMSSAGNSSVDAPAQFSADEFAELWRIREHLGKKVERELDLIGQRMTWLVTSQSFLFTAWVAAKKENPAPSLALVVSVIGFAIALPAFSAVCAALRVLDRMGTYYLESVEIALGLPPMGKHREDPSTIHFGSLPALLLPSIFGGTWAGTMVNALSPGRYGYWHIGSKPVSLDKWAAGVAGFIVCVGAGIACGYWSKARRIPEERTAVGPVLEKAIRLAAQRITESGSKRSLPTPEIRSAS